MFKKWDNISKISLIYFFSSLYFYLPVLTIYYQQKGLSFLEIGSLWGIVTFTVFLAEVPTGLLADRFGRKKSIIFALLFQVVGEILFLFAGNYLHFVLINIMKEPKNKYLHPEQSPITILKVSLHLITSNPLLRRIILFGLFTTPFLAFLNTFQPPYFELSNISLSWLGISRAVAGIIAIVFLRYAYKMENLFKENGVLIATLIPAFFYFLMSFIFHPIIGTMLFILNYSSQRLQEPLLADYYNIHITSDVRATTLSAINMLSSIYVAIMGLIVGAIADLSLPLTFLFIGIVILIGSLAFRLNKNHVSSQLVK